MPQIHRGPHRSTPQK